MNILTMVLNFREAGEIFEYKFIFYFPDFQEIPCKIFLTFFFLFTPQPHLAQCYSRRKSLYEIGSR